MNEGCFLNIKEKMMLQLLEHHVANFEGDADEISLSDGMFSDILMYGFLTVLLTPLMLRIYRKRIIRFMSLENRSPSSSWRKNTESSSLESAKLRNKITLDLPVSFTESIRQRKSHILRATTVAYIVFIVTGMLLSITLLETWHEGFTLFFLLCILALCPAIINVTPEVPTKYLLGLVWTLLIVWGVFFENLEIINIKSESDDLDFYEEFFSNYEDTLTYLAISFLLVHRTLRLLFVPLTIIGFFIAIGIWTVPLVWIFLECILNTFLLSEIAISITKLATNILIYFLCLWCGIRLFASLVRLYERRLLSELSLLAFWSILLIASVQIYESWAYIDNEMEGGVIRIMSLFIWIGITTFSYIAMLRIFSIPTFSRTLLVLRVFSKDNKTDFFLNTLQNRWRYAGPVLLIGGPDLATSNIDPYEIIKFFSFKTRQLFLVDELSQTDLKNHLDMKPDREGRFRIDDIFCFEKAWRPTVASLINLSDVILPAIPAHTQTQGK